LKEIRLKLSRVLVLLFSLGWICRAQLPDYYHTVSRVTWVVENIDKVRAAWVALGLSGIEEYTNIQLVGQYRGKPVTIYAWQITAHVGNLTVDMIQPAEAQANAYTSFLSKHGDGILAIVHEVPSPQALEKEILRMKGKGVEVLQRVTTQRGKSSVTYTYFDTEPEGKFALGLVSGLEEQREAARPAVVSHFSPVVWDATAVSAYWERLGFPAFAMQHSTPQADSIGIEVGYQRHTQFRYEWISPPPSPPNIYADYLNKHHREGIQHIGLAVEDLTKAIVAYEKLGYHVLQSGSGRSAYLDTNSAGGIVVELVRAN
jgi:catechol 2,3-dioxygenase-like lactoylglutathione lyase family enzyme